jgi:hypothetical protein
MAAWAASDLDAIGAAEELRVAPARPDGSLRAPTTIWVVRVDDKLYVRSWRGQSGSWFTTARATRRGHVSAGGVDKDVHFVEAGDDANDAVNDAYRAKYARYPGYVEPMVGAGARATTLELLPRDEVRA